MKISINKDELKVVVENYFKELYGWEGNVEVSSEGASIDIPWNVLPAKEEQPKKEVKEVKKEKKVEPAREEVIADNTITSLIFRDN